MCKLSLLVAFACIFYDAVSFPLTKYQGADSPSEQGMEGQAGNVRFLYTREENTRRLRSLNISTVVNPNTTVTANKKPGSSASQKATTTALSSAKTVPIGNAATLPMSENEFPNDLFTLTSNETKMTKSVSSLDQQGDTSGATVPRSSALLTNRGGKVMTKVVTKNIFWGRSWGTYTGDKISGMDQFVNAYRGSKYANTVSEYAATNGNIGSVAEHQGHVIDTSNATKGSNVNAVLAEVCKMIPKPDPSGNGFYAVFTDLPRGSAGYCAYHSYGNCGGVPVQFGYFWKLDGDSACNPQSKVPGRSQGLAALANVYAHELSEARTDPRIGTWLDAAGQENGDKCAWAFKSKAVALSDGSLWRLQGEWSNAAYLSGTGFPNLGRQKGCIESA